MTTIYKVNGEVVDVDVVVSQLLENGKRLERKLAAVTAERDALKAQLDAVPVKAIDFYYYHVDDTAPMLDGDIAGNIEAMTAATIKLSDWLHSINSSRG